MIYYFLTSIQPCIASSLSPVPSISLVTSHLLFTLISFLLSVFISLVPSNISHLLIYVYTFTPDPFASIFLLLSTLTFISFPFHTYHPSFASPLLSNLLNLSFPHFKFSSSFDIYHPLTSHLLYASTLSFSCYYPYNILMHLKPTIPSVTSPYPILMSGFFFHFPCLTVTSSTFLFFVDITHHLAPLRSSLHLLNIPLFSPAPISHFTHPHYPLPLSLHYKKTLITRNCSTLA